MKTYALPPIMATILVLGFTGVALRPPASEPAPDFNRLQMTEAFLTVVAESGLSYTTRSLKIGDEGALNAYAVNTKSCPTPVVVVPLAFRNVDLVTFVSTNLTRFQPGWKQVLHYGNRQWAASDRLGFQWGRLQQAAAATLVSTPYISMDAALLVAYPAGCADAGEIDWASIFEKRRYPRLQTQYRAANFR